MIYWGTVSETVAVKRVIFGGQYFHEFCAQKFHPLICLLIKVCAQQPTATTKKLPQITCLLKTGKSPPPPIICYVVAYYLPQPTFTVCTVYSCSLRPAHSSESLVHVCVPLCCGVYLLCSSVISGHVCVPVINMPYCTHT